MYLEFRDYDETLLRRPAEDRKDIEETVSRIISDVRERGDEALEHKRGLARARHARHRGEASARDPYFKGLHGMDGARLKVDGPFGKHRVCRCALTDANAPLVREKRTYARGGICHHVCHTALGNHASAGLARARADLYQMIGMA